METIANTATHNVDMTPVDETNRSRDTLNAPSVSGHESALGSLAFLASAASIHSPEPTPSNDTSIPTPSKIGQAHMDQRMHTQHQAMFMAQAQAQAQFQAQFQQHHHQQQPQFHPHHQQMHGNPGQGMTMATQAPGMSMMQGGHYPQQPHYPYQQQPMMNPYMMAQQGYRQQPYYYMMQPHQGPMYNTTCDLCNLTFPSLVLLQNHHCSDPNYKPYECPDCGKRYLRKGHWENHIEKGCKRKNKKRKMDAPQRQFYAPPNMGGFSNAAHMAQLRAQDMGLPHHIQAPIVPVAAPPSEVIAVSSGEDSKVVDTLPPETKAETIESVVGEDTSPGSTPVSPSKVQTEAEAEVEVLEAEVKALGVDESASSEEELPSSEST